MGMKFVIVNNALSVRLQYILEDSFLVYHRSSDVLWFP